MARLVVESGPNIGTDYVLWDYLVVGRQRTCDVVVDDERISRQNTAILAVAGSHVVRDLGSRNGTLLNGQPVDDAPLKFGDLVTVGSTELRFTPGSNEWIGKEIAGHRVLAELGGSRDVQRLLVESGGERHQMLILKEPEPARAGRFSKEVERNRGLRFQNVLSLGPGGEHEGRPYVLQRWSTGTQLSTRLFRGPLDLPLAIQVGLTVARYLKVLHAAQCTYYNLRPELIWLEGNDVFVEPPPPCSKRPLRSTRQEIEWARFRSPEEARKEPRSPASDVYALGLILFHCLTGKCAVPGVTAKEALTFHKSIDKRVAKLPPHVPSKLRSLVGDMLEKELQRRASSADALIAPLSVLADAYPPTDEPTPAAGTPAVEPAGQDFHAMLDAMDGKAAEAPPRPTPIPQARATLVPKRATPVPKRRTPLPKRPPAGTDREDDESSAEDLLAAVPSVVSSEPVSEPLAPVRGAPLRRGIGVGEAVMFLGIASVLFLIAWLVTELFLLELGPLPKP